MFGNVFSWVKEANEDVAQKDKLYDLSSSAADKAIFFRLGPSCRRLGFHTRFRRSASCFISIGFRMLPLSGFLSQLLLQPL